MFDPIWAWLRKRVFGASNESDDTARAAQTTAANRAPLSARSAAIAKRRRRKALIIGINYKSLANKGVHLSGCVTDARRMYAHVCSNVERELTVAAQVSKTVENEEDDDNDESDAEPVLCEVRVLCDEKVKLERSTNKHIKTRVLKSAPTRSAIERSLRWLVNDADPDTRLWLSYSGHGVGVPDRNGDERDGQDEALVPLDYERRGMIVDDWLRANVVDRLPRGARLFGVIDCCHSGTALDLPITLEDKSRRLDGKSAKEVQRYKRKEWRLVQQRTLFEQTKEASGDVLMLSGCRDNQTSADAWEDSMSTGALTHAFLKFCGASESFERLLQDMSTWLAVRGYAQRPLLSFGSESTEKKCLRAAVDSV